ncbi:MAG: flavodoxin family protein [Paludibacteraceae bacterium]|nr:flavodoxin family protein [Paludibacteraceae bacterium]
MNVLVISTSLRPKSNSDALAHEFARGAADAGHKAEVVSLRGKKIEFCKGCFACQQTQKCVIKDDAPDIVAKMHDADVIVFATPIYYYEMCGQLKTLLDRANPLYPSDYKFSSIYMLTTAAEDEAFVPERAVAGLTGWVDCFERARLAGTVFAGGVNEMGEIEGHKALGEAHEMGKTIGE